VQNLIQFDKFPWRNFACAHQLAPVALLIIAFRADSGATLTG